MCFLSFLIIVTVAAAQVVPYRQLPPPEVVRRDIRREGAAGVLWKKLNDGEPFYAFLREVASGDSRWLNVAALLKPVADAGASEMLDGALSEALAKAPRRVLPLLSDTGPGFTFGDVCSGDLLAAEMAIERFGM